MVSVDDYLMKIRSFKHHAVEACSDERFSGEIIVPWFEVIAPARAWEYGAHGLYRFGARGVFAQIINCYYRWQRFKEIEFRVDWYDLMRDAFGFGIIMGVILDQNPKDLDWNLIFEKDGYGYGSSEVIFEDLVREVWDENRTEVLKIDPRYIVQAAIALPFKLWKESPAT